MEVYAGLKFLSLKKLILHTRVVHEHESVVSGQDSHLWVYWGLLDDFSLGKGTSKLWTIFLFQGLVALRISMWKTELFQALRSTVTVGKRTETLVSHSTLLRPDSGSLLEELAFVIATHAWNICTHEAFFKLKSKYNYNIRLNYQMPRTRSTKINCP